tara:strand:- start:202 stop:1524 length:1323 start_codon:yes stop_codon:yes gene_type:complete
MSIDVDFFHYRCLIDEKKDPESLSTKHISRSDAEKQIFDMVSPKFTFVKKGNLLLSEKLIFIKNIALSESVHVNPLKDFQEYENWKNGTMKFPFYGKHQPLAIHSQDLKAASNQIKGTIGEVIAGIFFEGYFNGRIIVRPIYKYPDFIGWFPNIGFGYCESKCNDKESETVKPQLDENILDGRVPKNDLKTLIADAVPELTFKNDLTIFLSFSLIDSYKPAKIKHTVLELYTKHRVSPPAATSTAPNILRDNILENALKETIKDLFEKCREDRRLVEVLAQEGNWKIKQDLQKKILDIEKLANIKGKLTNIKDLGEEIDKLVDIKENKKLIDAAVQGEDVSDIKYNKKQIGINFIDKKIKLMEMEKLSEYDNNYDVYRQFLDHQSIIDLDRLQGEIPQFKDSSHEFYICGNALIGLVNNRIPTPSIIYLNDRRWKELALK